MKKLLTSIILIYLVLESVSGQSAWDNLKNAANDVGRAVSGTGCLLTVSPKLTKECLNAFDEEVEQRDKKERDEKVLCCAFLALQSCTLKIAKDKCGDEGEDVAKSFLNSINRGITSDECVDYGFISCITITQIIIFAAIVLAVLFVLSCVCCCCCRSGKRGGRPV